MGDRLENPDDSMSSVEINLTWNGQLTAVTTLDNHPEIASRIAILIGCFSVADLAERDILAKLLSITQDEAGARLWALRTQAERMRCIRETFESIANGGSKARALQLLPEIEWLTNARNSYAHALYAVRKEDGAMSAVYCRPFFTDSKKVTAWERVTVEELIDHITRARRLLVGLWDFLRDGVSYPSITGSENPQYA
jgi:hypothetical protein